MPNRWNAGGCQCCSYCVACFQAYDATTHEPIAAATIAVNGVSQSYAPPQTSVCFKGTKWTDVAVTSPANALPNVVSTQSVRGGPCPGLADCPCDNLPTTLYMTSSAPGSNDGILQSSTLVYGPGPSWAGLPGLPALGYWSPGTFVSTEPIMGGSPFYYVFVCYQSYYALRRAYQTTPIGSPFLDVIRYSWVVGIQGNTCGPPVNFPAGQIFPGGDPSCVVSISSTP